MGRDHKLILFSSVDIKGRADSSVRESRGRKVGGAASEAGKREAMKCGCNIVS